MVRFIDCAGEVYTIDTREGHAEARLAIREAGLESCPIREGEPGEAGEETGELLLAATVR